MKDQEISSKYFQTCLKSWLDFIYYIPASSAMHVDFISLFISKKLDSGTSRFFEQEACSMSRTTCAATVSVDRRERERVYMIP